MWLILLFAKLSSTNINRKKEVTDTGSDVLELLPIFECHCHNMNLEKGSNYNFTSLI